MVVAEERLIVDFLSFCFDPFARRSRPGYEAQTFPSHPNIRLFLICKFRKQGQKQFLLRQQQLSNIS